MKLFKTVWARLHCKHMYRAEMSRIVDGGRQKMIVYRCEKCGKKKVDLI